MTFSMMLLFFGIAGCGILIAVAVLVIWVVAQERDARKRRELGG